MASARGGACGDSSSATLGRRGFSLSRAMRDNQQLALELGAVWAGGSNDEPSAKLDSAIIFAPGRRVGDLGAQDFEKKAGQWRSPEFT